MGRKFWLKRLILAFVVASVLLLSAQLFKGAPLNSAVMYGLLWGGVTAVIFTLVGYIRYKRNPACMLSTRPTNPDDGAA